MRAPILDDCDGTSLVILLTVESCAHVCVRSIKTINDSMAKLTGGCQHIMDSGELRTMLQFCLQAGNYLNQGTFRGQATAVDVGFLSQVRVRIANGDPHSALLTGTRVVCCATAATNSLAACAAPTERRNHETCWNSSVHSYAKRALTPFRE